MRRRDFIKVVTGSAMAWPLAAHAQQDRILRGAKPADLPVQYPTKFQLVNLNDR